ncbi:hypothetical protein BDK51DRAFT_44821 [Blyttiomyces helicus]|uniref:Uncharacterized protein n=1 Tax=Blyttiomyces helicus TaxID=388810 RepID=A0A4P9WKB7_9FUNG|nr:hypothetical protein BDK51DRAFT_44821 [Blyttiomyces helicus]|eukprot:RKO93411.1 hypothetical protein BDK51DRAFT_44821 [Blyttiomyces helicus]
MTQSSGILINSTAHSAKIALQSNGNLYIGQEDLSNASTISLTTQKLSRMIIDASGNVTIAGNGTPFTGNVLSVYGKATFTDSVVINGELSLPTLSVTSDGSGEAILNTPTLTISTNLQVFSNVTFGNLQLISSTSGETSILSVDRTTGLSLPLKFETSSGNLSGVCIPNGFLVPGTLQIDGVAGDTTTGFSLVTVGNNLEITPGVAGASVMFNAPLSFGSGVSLYDRAIPTDTVNLFVESASLYIQTACPTTTSPYSLTIGGGTNEIISSFVNKAKSAFVRYDPTETSQYSGGVFSVSGTVLTSIGAEIRLEDILRLNLANSIEGVLGTTGWYYLGKLGVGRTTVTASLSWRARIDYDGVSAYSYSVLNYDTNVASLVLFQDTMGNYQVFVNVFSGPCRVLVLESPLEFTFSQYEGGSPTPSGIYSGYMMSWVQDFNIATTQSNAQLEFGSINVLGSGTVNNSTLTRTTSVVGNLESDDEQSHSVINARFLWKQHAIVLATKKQPAVVVDDLGNVSILSTFNNISGGTVSLNVAGGAIFQQEVLFQENASMADLSLTNGSNQVSMQCDGNGNLSVGSSRITNVGWPVGASDAVTMQYVEGSFQGLSVKDSVYAASGYANVDLTQPVTVVDGVTVMPGNRILVKDQSDAVRNGIYVVESAAPPSRSTDLAVGYSAAATFVFVNNGVDNANTGWICSTISGQDVVGVNEIAFTQFSGAGEFNTGPGLAKNGNTIQVLVDGSSIEIANNNLRVSSGIAGQGLTGGSRTPLSKTSIDFLSSVGTLTSGTWNAGVIGTAWGGTGSSSFNVGRVIYSNGASLTQSLLYFDDVNIRLGIDTLTPVSGLTVVDRDIQINQTVATSSSMIMSSSITNYTFALRNETSKLIISSGTGQNKLALTDVVTLDSTGTLMVNNAISTSTLTIGNAYQLTMGSIQNITSGPFSLILFSEDKTGTCLNFYGGLGVASNFSSSEFLRVGFYNGNYVVGTSATGTGAIRNLCLQTGGNTNQILLQPNGNIAMSGALYVTVTEDAMSISNGGALTVAGGGSFSGHVYAVGFVATGTVDTSISTSGGVTMSKAVFNSSYQNYSVIADQDGCFDVQNSMSHSDSIMQLSSFNGSNGNIVFFRTFGLGQTNSPLSEFLQIGFEKTSLIYAIRTNQGGSATMRSLVLSATANVNQVTLNTDGSTVFNDVTSTLAGGSPTFAGGLAVGKSAIVGTLLQVPAIQLSSTIDFSSSGSNDKVTANYTSTGNPNFFNNSFTTLNIHHGNSLGPLSSTQEKLIIGYGSSSTHTITSFASGSGTVRDISIKTLGNTDQIRLYASDGSVSTSGVLRAWSTQDSVSGPGNGALQVSGGIFVGMTANVAGALIVGSGNVGSMLTLNGTCPWQFSSVNAQSILFQPLSGNTVFSITYSNSNDILSINTNVPMISSYSQFVVSSSSVKALSIQSSSSQQLFTFDTGLNLKASVMAASPVNVDLTQALFTTEGVTLVPGVRVILMFQTNAVENGIYDIGPSNYLTRSSDFAIGSHAAGAFCFVEAGTFRGEKGYVCIAVYPNDVVRTNDLSSTLFNGNLISAGLGLEKDGNNVLNISLDPLDSGLSFNGGNLRIDTSVAGAGLTISNGILSIENITQVGTILGGTWQASVIQVPFGGTGNNLNGANFVYDDSKISFGMNSLPDPNNQGDGIVLQNRDLFTGGATAGILFGDSNANYNWRFRRNQASAYSDARGLPNQNWTNVADSKNGNVFVVFAEPGEPVYISNDSSYDWTPFLNDGVQRVWGEAVLSAGCGNVFTSNDMGTTFTIVSNIPTDIIDVGFVHVVKNGLMQFPGYFGGALYISENNGSSFAVAGNIRSGNWHGMAESGVANVLVLYENAGSIFLSTDFGGTWTERMTDSARSWVSASISEDGTIISAADHSGYVWLSVDSGSSFNSIFSQSVSPWLWVCVTGDGTGVIAGGMNIPVVVTNDNGLSFSSITTLNENIQNAAYSNSGGILLFPEKGGVVHRYTFVPSTNLIVSCGMSTSKSDLTDYIVMTDKYQLGIGYNSSSCSDISSTVDVNGTLYVSGLVTFNQPLLVSSGGTGVATLPYGLVISNGEDAFSSTSPLPNGAIPIGSSDGSGKVVIESGNTLRTHLGLQIGSQVQGWSANLDNLSTLMPTNGYFIVGNGTSFSMESAQSASSAFGLGSLAYLNYVNNSNFSGTQLSVTNGGTGSTNFTTGIIPFFNGTILTNTNISYDSTNLGLAINGSSVQIGCGLTVYGADLSINATSDTNPSSLLFYNSDGSAAWRFRRSDEGTAGPSSFVISGGVPNMHENALIDQFKISSSGMITLSNTTDTTSVGSGSLVVNGGISVAKSIAVGGSLTILNTGDSTEAGAGALLVSGEAYIGKTLHMMQQAAQVDVMSGGLAIMKKLWNKGGIVIETEDSVGLCAKGLTVGTDVAAYEANAPIQDSNRSLSLVNTASGGATILNMRNTSAINGWDVIVEGSGNNRLILQSSPLSGVAGTTWMTLDSTNGSMVFNGTNDATSSSASLYSNGGIYAAKSVIGSSVIAQNTVNGPVFLQAVNISNGSSASSGLSLVNDGVLTGTIFLNSSGNSSDGGANTLTLRNNAGNLRLQASGSLGITVTSSTGAAEFDSSVAISSTQDATSSTTCGSATIGGGLGVAKSVYVGGNVSISGSLTVSNATSSPSIFKTDSG